jgi:hypothetical protein
LHFLIIELYQYHGTTREEQPPVMPTVSGLSTDALRQVLNSLARTSPARFDGIESTLLSMVATNLARAAERGGGGRGVGEIRASDGVDGPDAPASDAPTMKAFKLIRAAAKGDVATLQRELDEGADVNSIDADAETALHWAAANDHADAVVLLLAWPGVHVDARNSKAFTPLIEAAQTACMRQSTSALAICQTLLDAGADPCAVNKYGVTSLHIGGYFCYAPVIQFFMKAGTDRSLRTIKLSSRGVLDTRSSERFTALECAEDNRKKAAADGNAEEEALYAQMVLLLGDGGD